MSNTDEEEKEIKECVELLGLSVEKIREKPEKSPDFLVKCDRYSYLVELKTKFDAPRIQVAFERAISSGEIVEEIYDARRQDTISKVIKSACKQLLTSDTKADFKLVWLHAKGRHPDFQMYDFESTLYGCEIIVDWGKDDGFSGFCYHYGNSDFYNHRAVLDGAVISTSKEMKLCLNVLSPRYQFFKRTRFREVFEEGVLDPNELERIGNALIVDSDVDRKDELAVMRYLLDKYDLKKAMKMPMQQISASVLVPNKCKI